MRSTWPKSTKPEILIQPILIKNTRSNIPHQVGFKRVHVLYDMNVKMVYTRYTNNMLNAYDMTSPITVDDSYHMQEYWSH